MQQRAPFALLPVWPVGHPDRAARVIGTLPRNRISRNTDRSNPE
jgi:hypothetical protein